MWFWLIEAAISLAGARASWHAFEKHFLKLRRNVRYDREVRLAPSYASHIVRDEAA